MESLSWFKILMLFGTLQGGILLVVINRLPRRHKIANRVLSVVLLLIVFNLFWQMQKVEGQVNLIGVIQDILFFLYGPFFYFYIRALLASETINYKKWLLHLLPSLVYIVLLFFMLHAPKYWYFSWMFTATSAVVHSTIYLVKSYQILTIYRKKTYNTFPHLQYLQTIIILAFVCLLAALYALVLYTFNLSYHLSFFDYHMSGIAASFTIYTLAYFAVLSPEIFTLPAEEIKPDTVLARNQPALSESKFYFTQEELQTWKTKLEDLMQVSKPFLNPTLTLDSLAKSLEIDKLTVSRIIYEGFQLRFYDFINAYRINYFVQLSQDQQYQHYTTLALAYEAGFNAKSTFHKAFKKIKNTTPTAYLKSLNQNQSV